MDLEAIEFLANIGVISTFVPFITLLFVYKKAHHKLWWAFFWILFLWIVSDTVMWIFANYSINNHLVAHFYILISTCLYLRMYYLLNPRKKFGLILISVGISYVLLSVLIISFTNSWFKPAILVQMMNGMIPLTFSILFFYRLLKSLEVEKLLQYPYYWINTAILIHFGVSFFAKIFLKVFYMNMEVAMYVWLIPVVSVIAHNILFSRGLWLMKRT